MRPECHDAIDEENCSYRSAECGEDKIDAGSMCWTLVKGSSFIRDPVLRSQVESGEVDINSMDR